MSDIDAIFGDGEVRSTEPVLLHLRNALFKPGAAATAFARDEGLYSKAWLLVGLAVLSAVSAGLVVDYFVNSIGAVSDEGFRLNTGFTVLGGLFYLAIYPSLRAVWRFAFGYGAGWRDRSLCAAAALSLAIGTFIDPVILIANAMLTLAVLPEWVPGENAYEKATMVTFIPEIVLGIAYSSAYFCDAFDIGPVKSVALNLLAFILVLAAVLIPLSAIGFALIG